MKTAKKSGKSKVSASAKKGASKRSASKKPRLGAPGPAPAAAPVIGQVTLFAFPFAPAGWLPCDGRLMSIMQNQQLFSLLGPAYGGNGETDFALPKLNPVSSAGLGYFIAIQGSYPMR